MSQPLRVLLLGSEMTWRGGESQVDYLATGLQAQGVEATIAYPEGSAAISRLEARLPILALRSRQSWDPRVVTQVVRTCDERQIALLDAHSAKAHALAVAVKRRRPQLKLVVHRHIDNPPQGRMLTRTKYLGPAVDRFVAISQAIGRVLRDYGVADERITVVRSATDAARFAVLDRAHHRALLLEKLRLSPETVLIGNASALTEQKGHDVLLEALHLLAAQAFPVHGVFAGEGEDHESLLAEARRLGIEKRVTFLGFVDEVGAFLQGLDILAVPSNREGLGTVILEGMLCGCPVAATRVGGIPEIITDGETGLLSPVRDPAQLARNLSRLIADLPLREAMVARAQARVRAEFSVQNMVEGNLAVYRSLLRAQAPT